MKMVSIISTPRRRPTIKDLLIDFGLPFLIIVICFVLLMTGKNSEVKSILTLAAGWVFKSGYQRKSNGKRSPGN